MNKKIFYLIFVLFCACTNTDKPLTDTEKESIINETKGLIATIMQTCESPDPEALKSLYINSSDFVSMVGGKYSEYEESLKGVDNYFARVKSQKATILSEKYVVLDPVTVLYTADSNWEVLLKNDSTIYMDPVGMQFLLRKTDGQWKVLSWTEEIKMK